jgi:hypothetical protein
MSVLVELRITPRDAGTGVVGAGCRTGNFTIDLRNAPPTCSQPLQVIGNASDITIQFDIDDVESDNADILFEYESPAGSGNWQSATPSGASPLANPALSLPTPSPGLSFVWDSLGDLGATMGMVNFRITVGDAFNTLMPLSPALVPCDSGAFAYDNTACVFNSIRILGPGSMLGAGTNTVGGGPMHADPCTMNDDYTFSLGGHSMGELDDVISFAAGGNPLVFTDSGQTSTLVIEGNFGGVCAGLIDITVENNQFGTTSYNVIPGSGGPYVQHTGNGTFQALATAPNAMSGCDIVTVTFTPNNMGMAGGSDGAPDSGTFAACLDYFGYDDATRNGMNMLPIGAFDANMIGTPSGELPPGAGGTAHIGVYGKANPTDVPSAFDFEMAYDSARLVPDTGYGNNGADGCPFQMGPWTATPNPTFMGMDIFLVNGFRITSVQGSSRLVTVAFQHVSAGPTTLIGTQKEWADDMATRIPGPQPLPWINPGLSSGFTLP